MSEVRLLLKFLKLTFKNWILWLTLFISIVGVILTYFTEINIPKWILWSLPYLALLITGYEIFKNSAPKITIDKPSETDVDIEFPFTHTYGLFNIKVDTYIKNFGLQSGTLEEVKMNFIGVNKVRDEFILKNMKITTNQAVLCKKKNGFHILNISSKTKQEYGFKFPIVLKPDTIIPLYIMIPMSISDDSSNMDEMLEWVRDVHFELEYKFTDSFGKEVRKVPFNVKLDNLLEIKEEHIESHKDFEDLFSGE